MKASSVTSSELSVLFFIIHSAADQVNIIKGEEELVNMSAEKDIKPTNDLTLLCTRVNQLKAQLLKKTHQADEKITFLTVTGACLNEVLLLQSQNVMKAGEFLKGLLNEPVIWMNQALVNKILTWWNGYKVNIVKHVTAWNKLRTEVTHFSNSRIRLFSHSRRHQQQLISWVKAEDLNRVYEEEDQWFKYAKHTELTFTEPLHLIEEDLSKKRLRTN